MEKQVDEFFRRKLEEHALAPSAHAWDKIEASLPKKNKTAIVWRIAAALVLMSGLLWAGLTWQGSKPAEISELKPVVANPAEPVVANINPVKKEKSENKIASISKKVYRSISSNATQPISIKSEVSKSVATTNSIERIELASVAIAVAESPIKNTQKPIILEYRLEAVETITVVHNEEKKGLKGFLNAAKEMKNGEDGLGLQTLKDNILAFNFKKEKGKPEEEKNY